MQEERLVASEPRRGDGITVQRNQHECWDRAGELAQARGAERRPRSSLTRFRSQCVLSGPHNSITHTEAPVPPNVD